MEPNHTNQTIEQNPAFTLLSSWLIPDQRNQQNEPIQVNSFFRWFEWITIFSLITYYCLVILDFQSTTILPGSESETFQILDRILRQSLLEDGVFPFWNPYIQYGIPYLADPMMHAFNPIISIPVLMLGTTIGFKLGLYLSFLLAGYGIWNLARVLNLNGPSRIWMALLFAFAGPPVARFFQGQYLFTIGYGLLPWCVSTLILACKYRKPYQIAIASLTISLLFFTGNVYYPFYLLFVILIYAIVNLFITKEGKLSINTSILITLAVIGLLCIGIISVHFFPLLEFHSYLSKSHLEITQAHTLRQIWLDLTSNVAPRFDAKQHLPPEEYYAYIGFLPFIALLGLPFAWNKNQKRDIIFFLLIAIFFVCCINLENMPWKDYLLSHNSFSQFRYPTRLLVYIILAVVTLAGISINAVLIELIKAVNINPSSNFYAKIPGYLISFIVISLFFSIINVFSTNRYHIHTISSERIEEETRIATWLREYDSSLYSVSISDDRWYKAMLENRILHYDVFYHFLDIRNYSTSITGRKIQPLANYHFVDVSKEAPPNSKLIKTINYTNIFKISDSFPFAFSMSIADIFNEDLKHAITPDEIIAISEISQNANTIEFIAESNAQQMIIVLQTWYPGWQVRIDGEKATLQNVSGFMAVNAQNGKHLYKFTFRPEGFYYYLSLTIISLILLFTLLATKNSKVYNRFSKFMNKLYNLRVVHAIKEWLSSSKNKLLNQLKEYYNKIPFELKHEASVQYDPQPYPSQEISPNQQRGLFSRDQFIGISVILLLLLLILKVIENIIRKKE